jgi:hypothetical protein
MARNLLLQDQASVKSGVYADHSLSNEFSRLTDEVTAHQVLNAALELQKLSSNLTLLTQLVGKHHLVMEELNSIFARKR